MTCYSCHHFSGVTDEKTIKLISQRGIILRCSLQLLLLCNKLNSCLFLTLNIHTRLIPLESLDSGEASWVTFVDKLLLANLNISWTLWVLKTFSNMFGLYQRQWPKTTCPELGYLSLSLQIAWRLPGRVLPSADTELTTTTLVMPSLPWITGCHIQCVNAPNEKYKLTRWDRDKMAVIFQRTFSNAFSWMKMIEFRLEFHWSWLLGVQLTIFQQWFAQWLGTNEALCKIAINWIAL